MKISRCRRRSVLRDLIAASPGSVEAGDAACPTPLTETALALFRTASGEGLGREDDAAVAKIQAAQAGVALPGQAG